MYLSHKLEPYQVYNIRGIDCVPAIIDGVVIPDYVVSFNGDLWSLKFGKMKKKAWSISGKKKYPQTTLRIGRTDKSIDMHRLVCFSFHKPPAPAGVSKQDWDITPDSVKALLCISYQVNHIDHVHANYHPSNLEWATVKENSQAWQSHKVKHGL